MPCRLARHGDRCLAGQHRRPERPGPAVGPLQPSDPVDQSSAARTARSASSSCAIGVPQTAMTASPMNFSIVPP